MKSRVFAVRAILDVTENHVQHGQISGHFLPSRAQLGSDTIICAATPAAPLDPSDQSPIGNSAQQDKETNVTSRHLRPIALIGILSLALSSNTDADTLKSDADHALAGMIAGAVVVVVVTVLVIHAAAQKRTITGCLSPAENGMTVTDEKNKRVYVLSGDTTGVKPGERMTLHLKKIKAKGTNTFTWEPKKTTKDFGACQP
jgi:hypothetical protein